MDKERLKYTVYELSSIRISGFNAAKKQELYDDGIDVWMPTRGCVMMWHRVAASVYYPYRAGAPRTWYYGLGLRMESRTKRMMSLDYIM